MITFLPLTIFLFLDFKDLIAIQQVSKYWRKESEKRYRVLRIGTFVLRSKHRCVPKDLKTVNNYRLICFGACNIFSTLIRRWKISRDLRINESLLHDLQILGPSAFYLLNPSERTNLLEMKFSQDQEMKNLISSSGIIKEDMISYYIQLHSEDAIRDLPHPAIDQCYSGELERFWDMKDNRLHIPTYEEPPRERMTDEDRHLLSAIPKNLEKQIDQEQKNLREVYRKLNPWTYSRIFMRCLSIPVFLTCQCPRFITIFGCLACGFCCSLYFRRSGLDCIRCAGTILTLDKSCREAS